MINQVSIVGVNQRDSTSPQGRVEQVLAVDGKGRLRVSVDYGDVADALSSMTSSSPTFAGLTISGLTASRLVATNASKALTSVSNLASWVAAGTGLSVANDGDGSITVAISDAELLAIAGLTSAADKLPYFTGSGTASLADFTSFGRSLMDDANATAGRVTLLPSYTGNAGKFLKVSVGEADVEWATISPGGSDTQLQYNDNGTFGGTAGLTWNKSTTSLSLTPAGTISISPTGALTVNPTAASTINNCSIGATTASTGKFTTVQATTSVTIDTMTAGSVLFSGTAGIVSQDNANLFWDDTNDYLGLRTATPNAALTVKMVAAEEAPTVTDITPAGGAWTLGAGWAGTNPFTHTPGSTATLQPNPVLWSSSYTGYMVDYVITGRTAGYVTLSYGGASKTIYQTWGSPWCFATNSSNNFVVTPTTDFDGTIQIVSIEKITKQVPVQRVLDSAGLGSFDIRGCTLASGNFGFGYEAGGSYRAKGLFYGNYNFAVGTYALQHCNGGYFNLALGAEAGRYVTSGDSNCFIGAQAGRNDIGDDMGRPKYSIGIGYMALYKGYRAYACTAIGTSSQYDNTDGYYNISIGNSALRKLTSGSQNIAIGSSASYNILTGNYTVAIGDNCLYTATTAHGTVAIGYQAAYGITTGQGNVMVGRSAGSYHNDGTTALTTPANSVYIGYDARGFNNSDSNTIAIGYQCLGLGANTTAIGNSSTTITRLWGDLGIGTSAPSAAIHSLKTTEQLRLGYDASNYMSVTVGSTGKATFNCVSGTAVDEFIFSDPVKLTNTGLRILDTNASHVLIIAPGSDLTADKTLTLTTGDADRTITLSGNPTLADWFDQSVKTGASPQFTKLGVGMAPNQKFDLSGGRAYFGANSEVYGIGIGYTSTRTGAGQLFFVGATDSATPDLVFSNAAGVEILRVLNSGRTYCSGSSTLLSLGVGYNATRTGSNQVYFLGATDSATPDLQIANAAGTKTAQLDYNGNWWVLADCSALTYTDRTPGFDKETSYRIAKSIACKDGQLDHNSLAPEIRRGEGRDLSGTVSALHMIIKDLVARIEALEAKK